MKNKLLIEIFLSFFFFFLFIPGATAEEQSIDEFIFQIQKNLENKNFPAYVKVFSPEIRIAEKKAIEDMFNVFQMDKVTFHRASKRTQEEGLIRLYFQVLFQNDYSAIIETWQLFLSKVDTRWQIEKKEVTGKISLLYKIKIPRQRAERVKSFEVKHIDIKLSFENALLFYDNIPGLETALLIIGKGRLFFSPSDPREQHQLQLIYKKKVLEDNIEYAYLRFSNIFFQKNIKIEKASPEKSRPVSQMDLNKAHSIFKKHYSRSFTIENSLSRELLSIQPQGDQAVFEFKGKKTDLFTYIYSPFAKEEVTLLNMNEEKLINLYSPSSETRKKRFFISFSQKFDVKSYQIDIDFNPRESYLSGKASVEIESNIDYLESVKFKLNPELEILRIFDEEKNALFYTRDKLRQILYVYLFRPPSRKKSYRIEIFYRGKLRPPKQTADVIAGPQFEIDKRITMPLKFQSHFFSQSAYWYPAPSDVDYFKARLKIIIPPDYSCVATGELKEYGKLNKVEEVERIEKMGNSVYVFETKYPVKYLSFIVGKFSKVAEDSESIPLEIFISPGLRLQKKEFLEEIKNILRFYQSLFGPYPYEKLSIIKRLWPFSGGNSPASFVILNELPPRVMGRYYVNSESPVNLSRWKEFFIAHEIAHQWWGQGVAWNSYHDQWLSEGLAQFSAILYLKEKRSRRIYSHILKEFSKWTEKKTIWGPITMGSRLSYLDFEAYQSIIYNKSSLVLNMLLEILGEELFFRGLREFYHDHKYSAASTKDFIKTMERVSEKDLKVFFDGWFDSYLLPEVRVSHSIQKKEDGYLVKFKFIQLKGLFVFPLWIEWKEKGQKVMKKVIISKRNEEFEFELKEKPEKIKVNPDKAVPGKFS